MNVMPVFRIFYHLVAFTIFMIQAQQSMKKYFQQPVVIQHSRASIDIIEKPEIKVCSGTPFKYGKASEYGYSLDSKFLVGMIPNSTTPTWKGIYQNSTFNELSNVLRDRNFSKISLNQPSKLSFEFGKGFYLNTIGIDTELKITSKDKLLVIYIVYRSTDPRIISNRNFHSFISLGFMSNTSFDYKVYELSAEVHDNSIYEGITCVDYRKQKYTYGDCNYNALKKYIFSIYGCYPPWMSDETQDKLCEIGIKSKAIDNKQFELVWKKFDMLTDGREIHLMKVCLPPCYQIKPKLEKKLHYPFKLTNAELVITNTDKTVKIFKAVYSFDIFTLTVELGSALGLWLGMLIFIFT
jgi:hypothetical protein